MAVIRPSFPDDHYTRVPNAWLRDPDLPPAPKAYLAYLLSHAAGYRCSTSQAARDMGVNRSTVSGWNAKLAERGYFLTVEQSTGERGRFGENDYAVTDCTATVPPVPDNRAPLSVATAQSTDTVKPRTVGPTRSGRHIEEQLREEHLKNPAAIAAGADGDSQLALVDDEPTLNQRVNTLTREHYDATGGLVSFPGVAAMLRRALAARHADGSPWYTDEQVRQALNLLRQVERPAFRIEDLRRALADPASLIRAGRRQSTPYRDPDPAAYTGRF